MLERIETLKKIRENLIIKLAFIEVDISELEQENSDNNELKKLKEERENILNLIKMASLNEEL